MSRTAVAVFTMVGHFLRFLQSARSPIRDSGRCVAPPLRGRLRPLRAWGRSLVPGLRLGGRDTATLTGGHRGWAAIFVAPPVSVAKSHPPVGWWVILS